MRKILPVAALALLAATFTVPAFANPPLPATASDATALAAPQKTEQHANAESQAKTKKHHVKRQHANHKNKKKQHEKAAAPAAAEPTLAPPAVE